MAANGALDYDAGIAAGESKDEKIAELKSKIGGLEEETTTGAEGLDSLRSEVARSEKDEAELDAKLASAKGELDKSEKERKSLGTAAARAAEVEGNVARLQHDLVTSITDGEEDSAEVKHLLETADERRRSKADAEARVRVLEEKMVRAESALSEVSAKESEIGAMKRELNDFLTKFKETLQLDTVEMKKHVLGEGKFRLMDKCSSRSIIAAGAITVAVIGIAVYAKKR